MVRGQKQEEPYYIRSVLQATGTIIHEGQVTGKKGKSSTVWSAGGRTQTRRLRYSPVEVMQGTQGKRTNELPAKHDLAKSHRC